jgi:hypothetical protein
MKKTDRYSYLFFILTYVFVAVWLFQGIVENYNFCLSGKSYYNMYALLAGISALLSVPSYIKHQKAPMRALGYFTLLVGLSAVMIACYRFFAVLPICQ